MSWKSRRASIVLLALIVAAPAVWLDMGFAQVEKKETKQADFPIQPPTPDAGMNPDGFLNGGISLPKDEKGRGKSIEAAVDYIKEEKWDIAIPTLQKLLEIDEDVFVRLTRKSAEGKDVLTWVSVKQEADRLIGGLPPAGLDFYKLSWGVKAADLLKKGKRNGDPGQIAEVMKKYAHTDAGGEAIKLLADYHLDRGNYIAAVLCFDKLLNREGADKLPPVVLFKAAYAVHMAPASTTATNQINASKINEKELWKQLRNQGRDVQLGPDDTRTVAELEEYVAQLERPNFSQNATDSVVYRSTPDRGNQLVGGPAFMSATWRKTMKMYEEPHDPKEQPSYDAPLVDARIKQAMKVLQGTHQPIIPAFSPITVTVNLRDKKLPLLIYKNYWGVVARDLKTGEIAWASSSDWSLEKMLHTTAESRKSQAITTWLDFYLGGQSNGISAQYPHILFENSTVGTLSTDGQFVYVIEDLAVPPMHMQNANMFNGMGNAPNYDAKIQDAISHSRLQAFELKSGKLTWQLGDPEEKGPLSDCFFLGPPLPLGGKLYVLTEKQQELRLVCLDPAAKGKVLSSQTLGSSQEKMENSVLRRTSAAHLSYGEGILVCPTNAGAVFGINLLENSLIWAYPYREKSDTQQQPGMGMGGRFRMRGGMPPGMVMLPNGQMVRSTPPRHNQWKASAPVISDGKVVFTAPDARSIHCINLRDGSRVWTKPKLEDDLYLGNVCNGKVLIVGKKNVRGLSLATGEILWTLDTGTPSGQGIASDNIYYLPLKDAGRSKEPQICAIDMDKGKIHAHTKSRPRSPNGNDYDVPGNLLFYEGDVISLTPDEVVVYPQLKVKIQQMEERIAKNPNDPIGLTELGDLRLDRGDLAGAIENLSRALKNNPDQATKEKARGKLYDTLTAYISDHFNDAEKYLKEYEDLCKVDLQGALPEKVKELQAEQRRRRATYLWLVGKGREGQGRLVEAFEKYQQFADEAGKQQELVPAIDERQVKAAPDVWSRGRIIAMMAKAKPEHREPLEKLIAAKWDKLRQTNDLNELRKFVRMFGSVSVAGKEARLQLVDRLMEQKDSAEEHPLLEAELELSQFRTGQQSPELSARATEALARLYTRKGLLEDAAYYYRKLGGEYAKILIRDGKTGRDFYDDTATDKRLLPYLDEIEPLGSIKFSAKREGGASRMPDNGNLFQFEHRGENLPFFRHRIVGLNRMTHEFKLLDRDAREESGTPKELWKSKLTPTMFQVLTTSVLGNQLNQFNRGMPINNQIQAHGSEARFPYRTLGHLIVLPVGHLVYGIDPVNHRILWEKNLAAGGSEPYKVDPAHPNGPMWDQQTHPPLVDPRDGSVLLTFPGGWAQRLGEVGPLEGQAICMQTSDSLTAIDPLTGRTLWSRTDVMVRNHLFADDQYAFVVEYDDNNRPAASRVFRAADGITVKTPDFSALFHKRLQVFGRNILLSEAGPGGTVVVRLYDALTGQDAWKQTYAARSLVVHSEDPSLTGVVEPDGKVHVVDLRLRKEVMVGQMETPAQHLRNVQTVHLLADRQNFYFACQAAMEANNVNPFGGVGLQSNVMTHLGMRTVPVNGMIYSFKRDSGEYNWYIEAANQMLVLEQFQELPIVLLTARHLSGANLGRGQQWVASLMSIEKKRGSAIFNEQNVNATNFFGVSVDARAGTVDFLSQNMKLAHFPKPEAGGKVAKPDAEKPAPPKSTTTPSRTIGKRLNRPAIDRARIREVGTPLPPR